MTTGNGAYATGGMRRDNGRNTAHKLEHIRQSLADIFSTPIGSRIQRREYGSHLFDLIDAPMNPANRLRLAAVLVDAASRWEPRVVLETAVIDIAMDGKTEISYTARTLDVSQRLANVFEFVCGVAAIVAAHPAGGIGTVTCSHGCFLFFAVI